jgi:hypothetical protein
MSATTDTATTIRPSLLAAARRMVEALAASPALAMPPQLRPARNGLYDAVHNPAGGAGPLDDTDDTDDGECVDLGALAGGDGTGDDFDAEPPF